LAVCIITVLKTVRCGFTGETATSTTGQRLDDDDDDDVTVLFLATSETGSNRSFNNRSVSIHRQKTR